MAEGALADGCGEPVQHGYWRLVGLPGARAFIGAGFLGRLPMSMLGLGIVVLISHFQHSYAVAGAVSATFTCASALGSPVLGALADRFGQRPVLMSSLPHALALAGLCALILAHAPVWSLFPAAIVTGVLLPPVSSMLRARWTFLLGGGTAAAEQAYALEAVIDEMVFIAGPVIVTTLGAIAPVTGLACSGTFVVVGSLFLAGQRRTEPPAHSTRTGPRGAWRIGGVRVLVCACVVLATALGTIDLGMVAFATAHGVAPYSGLLLACVAAGSGTSAMWYGRVHWRAPLERRFLTGCGVLVLSTVPLSLASSVGAMIPLAYLAGSAISPSLIAGFGLVERLVPPVMLTEGFTWVSTALMFGVGVGVTVSGRAIDAVGASRAFLISPTAVLLGTLIGLAGLPALRRRADG